MTEQPCRRQRSGVQSDLLDSGFGPSRRICLLLSHLERPPAQISTMTQAEINVVSEVDKLVVVENFIGGNFIKSNSYVDSFDPSTGDVWAHIPDSDQQEVNDAVSAARNAFPT